MICPNLSDPTINKQFNDLIEFVGEDFAYYVWDKNNGLPLSQHVVSSKGKDVVKNNPFYASMEELLSGDTRKANLAVAITFGNNFKKAYPKFDSMSTARKVNAVSNYVYSKEMPVEDVAKAYIKRANSANRGNNRAVSVTQEEVTRESLRKDPNSIVSQVEDVTAMDRLEAFYNFQNSPISQNTSFVNMRQVVNGGAYATWTKKALTLYRGSDFTDLYHESWHEFTQKFLTPQERTALYRVIKSREGSVMIGDKAVPYYELKERQVEEVLAEEYRAYAIKRSRGEKVEEVTSKSEGMISKLFNRIYSFLHNLFTGVSKTEAVTPEQMSNSNVGKLFADLYEGKIYTYKGSEKNITENLLKRSKSFDLEVEGGELSYAAHIGAELLDFMDHLLYSKMKKDGVKMSSMLSEDFRKGYVPTLYSEARQSFQDVIDDLNDQLDKATEEQDEPSIDIINERLAYLLPLVETDNNWDSLIKQHQSFVQGDIFKISGDIATKEDTQDQAKEDVDQTEQGKDISQYDDRSAVNPLQYYDPYVVELLRSLPNKRNVNGQVQIEQGVTLGLPKAGNFLENKNLLQDKLSGAENYEEVIERIKELVEFNPQMEDLLEMLPDPTKLLTIEELTLKNQFVQSMTMPMVQPLSVKAETVERIITEGNKSKPVTGLNFHTFFTSTLTQDALLEYFDNEFQVNATRNHRTETSAEDRIKFVNLAPEGLDFATFSVLSAITEYKLSPQSKTKDFFDFMSDAFGIDLYPKNKASFFKKDGSPNPAVFPYTSAQETAIRSVALAAYNKMVLYNLISKLDNKAYGSIKNRVNEKIETPARTFVNDLSKQLITVLEEGVKSLKGDLNITEEDTPEVVAYKQVLQHFKAMGSATLRNERQLLFKAAENYYKVVKSASYLNEAGDMEWAIREWQHLASEVQKINKLKNVNDLEGHLTVGKNDFVGFFNEDGEFETNSALLNKLFNPEGKRRKNRSKDNAGIELNNFTGFQIGAEGQKTINLNVEDKVVQDLGGFLKDGIMVNMTPGAKASYYAVRMNGSRDERVYFNLDTSKDAPVSLPSEVVNQFYKYLNFELSRAYEDSNGIEKQTAKQKRGSQFIIFDTILPKGKNSLQEQLLKSVSTSEKPKREAVADALQLIDLPTLGSYLNDFFMKELDMYKERLAESINEGYIERNTRKTNSTTLEERFNQVFPPTENLDATLLDYLINAYTHQVEYLHVFVADPSNFNIKKDALIDNNWRELFKRIGASISPGRQPRLDKQDLDTFNTYLPRELEKLVAPSTVRDYGKNFNYVQYKDVATFTEFQAKQYRDNVLNNYADYLASEDKKKKSREEYLTQAEEKVGKSLDAVAKQDKEADAQAYMNVDFMRYYLNSIGEWNPKLEKAYKNEVAILQKILAYRESQDPEVYAEIKKLMAKTDLGILTSLKLGYWGSPTGNVNYVSLGKYSVFPLTPSAMFETDLEEVMLDMYTKGVDFATFDSGSKMSLPVDSIPFYKEETITDSYGKQVTIKKPNPISRENIVEFPIEGLRRQQYIAPKFKNEVTLATQLVKLLFSNFYQDGELLPAIAQNTRLANKITNAQNTFIRSLETIVEAEKAKIYTQIGAEVVDGKIKSFDTAMFAEWIKNEFDKKDLPQSIYDYLEVSEGRFHLPIDISPQRSLFESVLASSLSKKVIKPKMFGEAYIQLASTGFNQKNTRFTNPTKEQVAKYGVSGLRDYGRIENGKHQPADIKLAFNKTKYGALLNLTHNGEVIGTVDRLNEALMDDAWVEEHSAKITIVGVRIPVQGFNSMEYLRVRQFLPETAGPIIIVPPSIVTKSGSDFDIDKLFMYEPELDDEGNLITTSKEVAKNPKGVYNFVQFRNENKQLLNNARKVLANKRDEFIARFQENKPLIDVFDSFIANNNMVFKVNPKNKNTASEEKSLMDNALTQSLLLEEAVTASKQDPEIIELTKTLASLRGAYQTYKDYTPNMIKAGASNELIQVMSDILSEPAVLSELIRPNSSPILTELADKYDEKYRGGKGKINASRIFSPNVSLQIFEEIASAKKALGIDAKANALHKLYQQVGLKYTEEFFLNNFKMRSNIDATGVSLGSVYEAPNPYRSNEDRYLISSVIDEFINGHVDAEKEDWINYFNADKTRTAIIQQMLLNGTPIEDALLLVNQPIVHHYIKNKRLNETLRALGVKPRSVRSYIEEGLKMTGLYDNYAELTKDRKFILPATIQNMLSDDLFNKHIYNFNEENYTPTTDMSRKSYDALINSNNFEEIIPQLAFLTQYALVEQQNKNLLNLTSVVDFNTAAYRNLNSFHKVAQAVKEAENFVNKDGLDKLIGHSVVSAFNITGEAITMGKQIFDVMGTSEYQDFLNDFIEKNGQSWDMDTTIAEVNSLNNAVVHSLIQRYSNQDGIDYYEEYGPRSKYLTQRAPGNLGAIYIRLFKKFVKYDKNLATFVRTNLFLKNFRKKDVESTNKFYVAMETNEKDPVTVDAIQASFIDGLDYNYSKPIVVNGETIDLNAEVQKFFQDVANATIVGQGYSIKYRSIQPYLPVASLDSAVGAMEQLRLLKDTIFSDETGLSEEEKEANSQARANFINNLDSVRKLYVKQAYAKGVKSLNRIKFFPDYVQTVQSKGIQISPTKKGIGAMLTPNTKESKVLKSKFPIMYEGKQYDDVMAVYNAYKLGYEIESKRNNNNLLVKLMSDILAKRFVQYPRMFGLVYDLGGVSALEKSYYKSAKGLPAKAWSTSELGPGNYIQSLINAYNEVETELTPAWLETKKKAVPAEQQEDYQEGELVDDAEYKKLLKSQAEMDDNIMIDPGQPTFDVEDLGIPLKGKGKQPQPIEETVVEEPGIDIGKDISLKYSEITTENLVRIMPNKTQEQLEFVVKNLRDKVQSDNPDYDFTNLC
jgi:hypothetical protein